MRHLTAAAAVVAALVLAACSPDAADFKSEAEEYIETRRFSEEAELLRYSDAECEEPASTAEDTRFTCTATAEDGTQWRFDVLITGERRMEVLMPPEPVPAASAESSVPGSAAPATTAAIASSTTTGAPTTTTAAATATSTAAATTTTTAA
jgi:hypothetical protein